MLLIVESSMIQHFEDWTAGCIDFQMPNCPNLSGKLLVCAPLSWGDWQCARPRLFELPPLPSLGCPVPPTPLLNYPPPPPLPFSHFFSSSHHMLSSTGAVVHSTMYHIYVLHYYGFRQIGARTVSPQTVQPQTVGARTFRPLG